MDSSKWDDSVNPFQTRDRIARTNSPPQSSSFLSAQKSMPNLRNHRQKDGLHPQDRVSRVSNISNNSEKFWAGFTNSGRPTSLEEGDLPTPVAFDEVVPPAIFRKMQEQTAQEQDDSPFGINETEEQRQERLRKLKMTEKWYEAQRRREYEAKYGKPPPNARNQAGMSRTHSDQPNRPPKSPARSASRPGSGSPGGMHRTPSQRYPSIAGSHLDVGGINAYPSPPSSSHTTTTNYYSEMSSPFSEGHGHTLGMMTPQRQAPLPGRNNSTRSTNGPIPARPSQPAPALTIYNQPTMEEGTAVDNANANTAPAPDKAGCCVIL